MKKNELFEVIECLKLPTHELPVDINLPAHEAALRKGLVASRAPARPGFSAVVKDVIQDAAGALGAAFRLPIWKPALAIIVVLALTLAVAPVLNTPAAKVSASDIALNDPQVRASFTPVELSRLNVEEIDEGNGQKVVLLTCDTAMIAVSVNMVAGKITEWLLNTVNLQSAAAPSTKYQLILESPTQNDKNQLIARDFFLVNADGSGLMRITDGIAEYMGPDWSEKSGKVVFSSDKNSEYGEAGVSGPKIPHHGFQIYTMNANGSDVKLLTWFYEAGSPKWSPDGTKIVFSAVPEYTPDMFADGKIDNDYELYVMNADGSDLTRLTDNYNPGRPFDNTHAWPVYSQSNDLYPAWSPDGTKITFVSDSSGANELCIMNADGTNLKKLTDDSTMGRFISWSPDCSRIAFISSRSGVKAIYTMNADGSNVVKLTEDDIQPTPPVWSPEGTKIIFSSKQNDYLDIYAVNPDGTALTRLANLQMDYIGPPLWSPDGKQIAFYDTSNVYTMNSDGSNLVKIAKRVWGYTWVCLDTYPEPPATQNETPTGPRNWPVTENQAIAIASRYVPANVVNQSKIIVDYGKSDPVILVSFEYISINKSEIDWEQQFNIGTAPPYNVSRPKIFMFGDGPYKSIAVSIGGMDGQIKSLWAFN